MGSTGGGGGGLVLLRTVWFSAVLVGLQNGLFLCVPALPACWCGVDRPQGDKGGQGRGAAKGGGVSSRGGRGTQGSSSKGGGDGGDDNDDDNDGDVYDLRCVLYHKGRNVHSGHIVAEVRLRLRVRERFKVKVEISFREWPLSCGGRWCVACLVAGLFVLFLGRAVLLRVKKGLQQCRGCLLDI